MSQKYNDYLKTDYWKRVAEAVKKRADYKCQLCNSQHDLCAHHRDYSHRGNELNYLNDLVCLCRRCHEIFHGKVKETQAPPQPAKKQKTGDPFAGLSKSERKEKLNAMRMETAQVNAEEVEKDMPPGDGPIELTNELIQRCRTSRGAFTNASIIPLGASFPLVSGWAFRLIGNKISRAEYRQALEGRYIYGIRS